MKSIENLLNKDQLESFNLLKVNKINEIPKLNNLFEQIKKSFVEKVDMKMIPKPQIEKLRYHFIEFEKSINSIDDSVFIEKVKKMNKTFASSLIVKNSTIKINFLYNEENDKWISLIIHAINTFCYTFDYDYGGLEINVVLNDDKRIFVQLDTCKKTLEYLKKNTLSFNVSGTTQKVIKEINISRTQEIIKLIFHELIHFIGLDDKLFTDYDIGWLISPVKLYEAYAEFMSIIINCCYYALQIGGNIKTFYEALAIEQEYSVMLSANILKIFGYDQNTYTNFFKGVPAQICKPNIFLTEYVFIRAILFCNFDRTISLGWKINDVSKFIEIVKNDKGFINEIAKYIGLKLPKSVTYTVLYFDVNNMI